jgi:hypothetical protein
MDDPFSWIILVAFVLIGPLFPLIAYGITLKVRDSRFIEGICFVLLFGLFVGPVRVHTWVGLKDSLRITILGALYFTTWLTYWRLRTWSKGRTWIAKGLAGIVGIFGLLLGLQWLAPFFIPATN